MLATSAPWRLRDHEVSGGAPLLSLPDLVMKCGQGQAAPFFFPSLVLGTLVPRHFRRRGRKAWETTRNPMLSFQLSGLLSLP